MGLQLEIQVSKSGGVYFCFFLFEWSIVSLTMVCNSFCWSIEVTECIKVLECHFEFPLYLSYFSSVLVLCPWLYHKYVTYEIKCHIVKRLEVWRIGMTVCRPRFVLICISVSSWKWFSSHYLSCVFLSGCNHPF